MKISVITVSYNNCATLLDTLNSVASQTHPDVEHIIIDGGSSDGTIELLEQWRDRLSTIVSEPDHGIYDAMNKGLMRATGDYIGFLNADDIFSQENILATMSAVMHDKNPDFCFGDLVYVQPDNLDAIIRHWSSGSFQIEKLRRGWMPPHPTFYVHRAILKSDIRFDTSMSIAADYEFMLRVLSRPGVRGAYIPEVLVKMRTGGASNRSVKAMLRKSKEDFRAIRRHHIGGIGTLVMKNLRKIPQFIETPIFLQGKSE